MCRENSFNEDFRGQSQPDRQPKRNESDELLDACMKRMQNACTL